MAKIKNQTRNFSLAGGSIFIRILYLALSPSPRTLGGILTQRRVQTYIWQPFDIPA